MDTSQGTVCARRMNSQGSYELVLVEHWQGHSEKKTERPANFGVTHTSTVHITDVHGRDCV